MTSRTNTIGDNDISPPLGLQETLQLLNSEKWLKHRARIHVRKEK